MGGHHHDEQIPGGEMGEKGKGTSSCAVDRGRTGEAGAVRNRLIWMACLLFKALVMSRPGLLTRAMSGSMALPQPGSVLTSVAHVAT